MSGIKPITSYFKVRSKDELEVEELLLSQVSRHSRASSLQHALTISTVSQVEYLHNHIYSQGIEIEIRNHPPKT